MRVPGRGLNEAGRQQLSRRRRLRGPHASERSNSQRVGSALSEVTHDRRGLGTAVPFEDADNHHGVQDAEKGDEPDDRHGDIVARAGFARWQPINGCGPWRSRSNPEEMYNFACFLKDKEPARAEQLWRQAAEAGDTAAMYALGKNQGTNRGQARRYYERAAEGGYVEAMYALGRMLTREEPATARRYYEQAAAHLACKATWQQTVRPLPRGPTGPYRGGNVARSMLSSTGSTSAGTTGTAIWPRRARR